MKQINLLGGNMKKSIILIIFSLGLLLSFYSGYNSSISEHQNGLIEEAIINQDYNFFLKFNSHYDEVADVNENHIVVNKIYNQQTKELGYNVIIRNLDIKEEHSNIKFKFVGEKGSLEKEYGVTYYNNTNILNLQFTKKEISETCGSIINSIEVGLDKYTTKYDINLNVESHEEEVMLTKEIGYSSDELNDLSIINNFKMVGSNVLKYVCGFSVCLIIFLIGEWIYKKKL